MSDPVATAVATKTVAMAKGPASTSVGGEYDEPKFFTTNDLVIALEKQKLEMEANFAKEREARSAMHMPSVGAQLPPPSASANTAPVPPSQFGGPYQWVYPTPKAEKPKYNFNGNPPVLTKDSNFLDWKVLMANYLVHVSQEMWDLIES